MQSPTMTSHDETQQGKKKKEKRKKKELHDQKNMKVVYKIKLSSMRSQIKSPIKDQFCFDIMFKSKKYSKRKERKENFGFFIINSLEIRYNTIRI